MTLSYILEDRGIHFFDRSRLGPRAPQASRNVLNFGPSEWAQRLEQYPVIDILNRKLRAGLPSIRVPHGLRQDYLSFGGKLCRGHGGYLQVRRW
jgi:hypothetical protein